MAVGSGKRPKVRKSGRASDPDFMKRAIYELKLVFY
jgi:hypothetical protein